MAFSRVGTLNREAFPAGGGVTKTQRRFIIVTENPGITPSRRQQSLEDARMAVVGLGVRIGDLRVAQRHLEFDVFAPATMLPETLKRLEGMFGPAKYLRNLDAPPISAEKRQALLEAVRLFNCQRYWETHEVLEGVWRKAQGEERRLLQALILLAAAYVHTQKGRDRVALGILTRAQKLLQDIKMRVPEVDLVTLREAVRRNVESASVTPFQIPMEGGVGRLERLLGVC
jgi:hypothetical protein